MPGWPGLDTIKVTAEKPAALIYLDDRAVRFRGPGPGAFPSVRYIHGALPWHKRKKDEKDEVAALLQDLGANHLGECQYCKEWD